MDPASFEVPRVVVAQAEPPASHRGGYFAVGVVPWNARGPQLSVVAKLTLDYGPTVHRGTPPTVARLAAEQLALSLAQPSEAPDAEPSELYYPGDFVPRKGGADVLLVGHAHGSEEAERIDCRVATAGFERRFTVAAEAASKAIALTRGHIRGEGSATLPVGPSALTRRAPGHHASDFDYSAYNAASEAQRAPAIAADSTVELHGLSRHGDRSIALPGLVPRLRVESRWHDERELELAIDTLWIDTDLERMVLVWRGQLELMRDSSEVSRLLLALERMGSERGERQQRSALQRGRVEFAASAAALERGIELGDDEPELLLAHYANWLEPAPEPRMPLERYALISAELAERGPDGKDAVLEAHELSDAQWTAEERAWLEKIGQAALNGDATLSNELGRLFSEAQAELSKDEQPRSLDDYAEALVALERSDRPDQVLSKRRFSLPQWIRLDRHHGDACERDPAIRAELEQKLATLRAEATTAEAEGASSEAEP
jgi:hypothetical protein